jgi:high-affinity iron transporter
VLSLVAIAVLREGFEVVVFIAAKFQEGVLPIIGAVTGLVAAVAIGIGLFQFGMKINLRTFFQVMGLFLLAIVAGLVVSALGHFDKAALVWSQQAATPLCLPDPRQSCVLGRLAWDLHAILPDKQFPGVVLKALFGYRDKLYLGQAIAYGSFLGTAGWLYFQSLPPSVKGVPVATNQQ